MESNLKLIRIKPKNLEQVKSSLSEEELKLINFEALSRIVRADDENVYITNDGHLILTPCDSSNYTLTFEPDEFVILS